MASESMFRIDVNLNHERQTRPTAMSQSRSKKGMGMSGAVKGLSARNIKLAGLTVSSIRMAKTYADLQFGKAEKTMMVKRYNAALGAVKLGLSYPKRMIEYDIGLEKKELRYNYTNEKYRQDVIGGSRWGGR